MQHRSQHCVNARATLSKRQVTPCLDMYNSVWRSIPPLPATFICLACAHLRCRYVLSPGCPGPAASTAAASRACLAASAACSRAVMRAAAWAASLCWTARRSAACRHASCVFGKKTWPLLGAAVWAALFCSPLPGTQEPIPHSRSAMGTLAQVTRPKHQSDRQHSSQRSRPHFTSSSPGCPALSRPAP